MAMILLVLSAVCMLAGFALTDVYYFRKRVRLFGYVLLSLSFALAVAAVAVNSNNPNGGV